MSLLFLNFLLKVIYITICMCNLSNPILNIMNNRFLASLRTTQHYTMNFSVFTSHFI
jgi:hypothetical protein